MAGQVLPDGRGAADGAWAGAENGQTAEPWGGEAYSMCFQGKTITSLHCNTAEDNRFDFSNLTHYVYEL